MSRMHFGVRVVGARAIHPHPERVARARARRANVRVAVVAIHAPRGEHAFGVPVFARAADVIHHLVRLARLDRAADAAGEIVERLVPRDALPLPFTARSRAFQRKEDAFRIRDLVERRRSLRAIPPATSRVVGISLELADLFRLLIDVRQESARGLAVEARRRHEAVVSSALDPIVPPLDGRKRGESLLHAALVGGVKAFSSHEVAFTRSADPVPRG